MEYKSDLSHHNARLLFCSTQCADTKHNIYTNKNKHHDKNQIYSLGYCIFWLLNICNKFDICRSFVRNCVNIWIHLEKNVFFQNYDFKVFVQSLVEQIT